MMQNSNENCIMNRSRSSKSQSVSINWLISNCQTTNMESWLQDVLYKFNRTTCFGQLIPSSGP